MGAKQTNTAQQGFTIATTLVVAMVVTVIGLSGWLILQDAKQSKGSQDYNNNGNNSDTVPKDSQSNVNSYDECVQQETAVILETYPEQCRVGDKTFTNPDQQPNDPS